MSWIISPSFLIVVTFCAGGFDRSCAAAASPATRSSDSLEQVRDAKGLDQALERLHAPMRQSPPRSPQEELKRFHPRTGLAVDLIASEPVVRQPVCINFDERGRMWVVQYIQYPFPAGLKVVEYDQYIRAKFDKVPLPPPRGVKGHDRITILEDVDGDGSFRKAKTFVDGLNITTSALPGRGGRFAGDWGVWVMNPPYLLFYPDKNRDDVPDGDPIVHLSGFGLEDTHAVANNLTWGSDGWLYGCQGSTCTAKVKVEITGDPHTTDFLGQAIWRYHPETHRFEVFAEGGGNTFGLEFDDAGRTYSGTNWGNYRGLYYVQGGYYIKSWGKHGPLTNPYAFGYFEHMPHNGNADRLSNTFIVYGGGLLGPEYTGKIISPNPLQSRVQVTRLEPLGSSYKTVEEPFLATCDDGWFRPVDLKAGPDGAIYVADFYERRISHVDPRDTWDRSNGRVFRIRPADWKPGLKPFDLGSATSGNLVDRLKSQNRWDRQAARVVLAARKDQSIAPPLRRLLAGSGQPALEALWALNVVGSLDEPTLLAAMDHPESAVRMWAVRLAGDAKNASVASPVFQKLLDLAVKETEPQVRSQLASTAKRLSGEQSVPLVRRMLARDDDAGDVHIPLLLWWAIEEKAVSHRSQVLAAFTSEDVWQGKIARQTALPRLARRWAADPSPGNQKALTELLASARGDAEKKILLSGVRDGLVGINLKQLQPGLRSALAMSGDEEISLRLGEPAAVALALRIVGDKSADVRKRERLIALLGEVATPAAAPVLLDTAEGSKAHDVRRAAIAALGRFEDADIGSRLVALYPKLPGGSDLRGSVVSTLLGRPRWTADLLHGIASGSIPKADLDAVQLQRIRESDDPRVAALAEKIFGKVPKPTSQEKQREVERVTSLVTSGTGDARAGKELFTARCAVCHTLFGSGGKLGPDLTGYERRNVDFLVLSVVDPSAYVREEYTAFRVRTRDGQVLLGLITERGANQITLMDSSQQKTVIPKDQILDERAMSTSLMPEGLLQGLSDQQVRDLFKYLSSQQPPGEN